MNLEEPVIVLPEDEGERPEGDTVVWRDLLVDRLDVREQLRVPVRILPTRDQGGNEPRRLTRYHGRRGEFRQRGRRRIPPLAA